MKISIVIIAYNEEAAIGRCITSVQKADQARAAEILVVDGGSTDRTGAISAELGVAVFPSKKGRGNQCQRGADAARGDILVFLHADSLFPVNGFTVINRYFHFPQVEAATFRMRFDTPYLLFKISSFFTRFDSIFTSFGDQGIVVRRSFYNQVGGFPPWQLFEDVHFLRQARKSTKIISLPAYIITSARRFLAAGLIRQKVKNFYFIFRYLLGVPGDVLAAKYSKHGKPPPLAAVAVMAKYPEPGKVKTRLAATLGSRQASQLYNLCAQHCLQQIKKTDHIQSFVFYSGGESENVMAAWTGPGFELQVQQGAGLGQRLDHACQYLLGKGFAKAVVVGSDVPDMNPGIINDTLTMLDQQDVVLGPSRDGGYFLIGLKSHQSQLFENIDWSTDRVLNQTVAKIEQIGLSWALLPELMDIDTEEDLSLWCSQAAARHPLNRKFGAILKIR